MVSPIIESMLEKYDTSSPEMRENALKEVLQNIVLKGLEAGGFFNKASFYGGTALRICYGLDRFSEDLDFCLDEKDSEFNIETFFPSIIKELEVYGFKANIQNKKKSSDSVVKSAFIKQNTVLSLLNAGFAEDGTHPEKMIKIKIEIDTSNPQGWKAEPKLIKEPVDFKIKTLDLPSLFAGKLHAVIARSYKNNVKGRDYYDWIFYDSLKCNYNLDYLQSKLIDSGHIEHGQKFNNDTVKSLLLSKIETIDFKKARKDVDRFLYNPDKSLEDFEKDTFIRLTEAIRANESETSITMDMETSVPFSPEFSKDEPCRCSICGAFIRKTTSSNSRERIRQKKCSRHIE